MSDDSREEKDRFYKMSKLNNHKIQENESKIDFLFKKLVGFDLTQPKGFSLINKSLRKITYNDPRLQKLEKAKRRAKSEKRLKPQKYHT